MFRSVDWRWLDQYVDTSWTLKNAGFTIGGEKEVKQGASVYNKKEKTKKMRAE